MTKINVSVRALAAFLALSAYACGSVVESTHDAANGNGNGNGNGGDAAVSTDGGGGGDDGGSSRPDAAPEPEFRLPDSETRFCSNGDIGAGCPFGDGQDGDYLIDVPSYELRADGDVVFDDITLLVWAHAHATVSSLGEAIEHCDLLASAELGGRNDWRVPSRFELVTLIDAGRVFLPAVFPAPPAESLLMTSTPAVSEPDSIWLAATDFLGFLPGNPLQFPNTRVRCVSGEVPEPAGLEPDGNNGALDPRTGLTWHKGLQQSVDWHEALEYCEALATDGHDDWRLPNIKELSSLVDDTRSAPAHDPLLDEPTGTDPYLVWSSTPEPASPDSAYLVDFGNGRSAKSTMTTSRSHARCVR